jgi:radical SAM superfamily enzyme YgiQ (UPF0313 family)
MKNILLIWPPSDTPNMNFLPIGFGYLASNIGGNYKVEIRDFVLDKYSDSVLRQLIEGLQPLAVGISFWEFNYNTVKRLVKKIKEIDRKITVILGGPSASTRENSGLAETGADIAIKGEGEKSFGLLLDLISAGRIDDREATNKIPGATYFDKIRDSYVSLPIEPLDLAQVKRPDYEKIRTADYLNRNYEWGYFSKKVKNYPIMITRGCPFQCDFCSARKIHGTAVRKRTVESALEEIIYLYDAYSIRGINILDDNFTFDKDYVMKFCKTIIAHKSRMPDLLISAPNGIHMKTLDDEMLDVMKQAGWESVTIAPESGSEKTLKAMKKAVNLEEVKYYVSLIKRHAMKLFGFFIIGYPGETVEDIKKTIDFACSLPFDLIMFSLFTPLPGTPIYNKLLESGEIDRNYTASQYHDVKYSPRGITLKKLFHLHRMANIKSLFLSPKRLFFLLRSYSPRRMINVAKRYLQKNIPARQ